MPRKKSNPPVPQRPLKPVDLGVLLVLAEEERHGYGIVQDLEVLTEGRIQLVAGNLYSVLRRLLSTGLIEESARRPAPDLEDARRKYYRITDLGRTAVRSEATAMHRLLSIAEARVGWTGEDLR